MNSDIDQCQKCNKYTDELEYINGKLLCIKCQIEEEIPKELPENTQKD